MNMELRKPARNTLSTSQEMENHPQLTPPHQTMQITSSEMEESQPRWATTIKQSIISELRAQRGIVIPLAAMNLTWFAKNAVTTAFLGRLGELSLAGGVLGLTIANVTGFSVLSGLCGAMEPICGQANGAGNYKKLHKTLIMTILTLLAASVPISLLWLNVDKILLRFGQQRDIAELAQKYITYLLPDLVVTSFLSPLKSYLSSQGVTVPTLISSSLGLAFHVPINILLVRAKGLQGVSMAIWLTDLLVVLMLATYVLVAEMRKGEAGGWWEGVLLHKRDQLKDWMVLLRLAGPCCMTACLEWWCYEILVLLTGRLHDARRMVAVIAVVLNFDYLLFSIMLSLATCASMRVSNELGAGSGAVARRSAYVSLGMGVFMGVLGASVMVGMRGYWGFLFSHDRGVINGVRKTMVVMSVVEVVNFPLAVCGGIVRGTARPWLAVYASLGGFYLVALPVAVVLCFRLGLGLGGLLLGFLVGAAASLSMLLVFLARIDWAVEAKKAQKLAGIERQPQEGEMSEANGI